jgi:siroheme synthase
MISAKKVITTSFAVAALVLLTMAAVSAADGPAVMITDYKVEPEVLMPGDTGTITVTIQNKDTQSSERPQREV